MPLITWRGQNGTGASGTQYILDEGYFGAVTPYRVDAQATPVTVGVGDMRDYDGTTKSAKEWCRVHEQKVLDRKTTPVGDLYDIIAGIEDAALHDRLRAVADRLRAEGETY